MTVSLSFPNFMTELCVIQRYIQKCRDNISWFWFTKSFINTQNNTTPISHFYSHVLKYSNFDSCHSNRFYLKFVYIYISIYIYIYIYINWFVFLIGGIRRAGRSSSTSVSPCDQKYVIYWWVCYSRAGNNVC